ncbi:hypothetical protein SEPCBS57363_004959 [Sporothrix epigloea]|uniref:FAR1 domain-containing protein n=1 Tax=Sporothrix epigloea TaxID=1892477 RepID=A0ABP0DUY5_9PEZI
MEGMLIPERPGQRFLTENAAYEALRSQQLGLGFLLSKGRTNGRSKHGFNLRVDVRCQCSGTYRMFKNKKGQYNTKSKKTDCPFSVRIRWNRFIGRFEYETISLDHNHDPINEPIDSSRHRRVTQELFGIQRLKTLVEYHSKGLSITAREIAIQITAAYPEVKILDKDVYHFQRQLRLDKSSSSTPIQPQQAQQTHPRTAVAAKTDAQKKEPTAAELQKQIDELKATVVALQKQLPLPLLPSQGAILLGGIQHS